MSFDELKSAWDEHDPAASYAVDRTTLDAAIRSKTLNADRCVSWWTAREIGVGLAAAAYVALEGAALAIRGDRGLLIRVLDPEAWAASPWWFFLSALLILRFPAAILGARMRFSRRAASFPTTVSGELDRAINLVESQISMIRSFLWTSLLSLFVGSGLFVALVASMSGQNLMLTAVLVAVPGAFFVAHRMNRRFIRERLVPRLRSLETLRAELVGELTANADR